MLTLAAPCRFECSIRNSVFIAHAAPVASEADTLAFFESVADPGASHNCWAWRLNLKYRSNDDGEPGGTAGRPILSVLEARELDRVMVVVTRHFGGILLGAAGLVRAYSGTAAKCLDQAQLVRIVQQVRLRVSVGFACTDAVHKLLDSLQGRKLKEDFSAQGLELEVEVPADHASRLRTALADISRGQALVQQLPA